MKPCRVLARHQRAFRQASEEPAIISTFCTRAHKNQARIPVRWESPVIKKVWVVCDNNAVISPGSGKNILIAMTEQINVPHMLRVETILPQDFRHGDTDALVHEESRLSSVLRIELAHL